MITYQASDTFKLLWKVIIEELLVQVCANNINYCVRCDGSDEIHYAIGKKFEEYRNKALQCMVGNRLDRHKLASCICGAIIEVQPLAGYGGAEIIKNANEIFAMYVGLNVVKLYMIYELLMREEVTQKEYLDYLKENFDMDSPSIEENVCDTKNYRENMANALYRSHHNCDAAKKVCHHFDIWAYSKIFYHLEIFNKKRLDDFYAIYKSGSVQL